MLLTGLQDNSLSRKSSGGVGEVGLVELQSVHRFTRPIYRLVVLIQRSHPAILDEGDDWTFKIDNLSSSVEGGECPTVVVADSARAAVQQAIGDAHRMHRQLQRAQRVALIAAGAAEFDAVEEAISAAGDRDFTVLHSRDEADQLNYVRRSIVFATSLDCAGLQFTHVVVLIFANRELLHGRGGSATRAAITDFYLSVSRAEQSLRVVTTRGEGTVSDIIEGALHSGVVVSGEMSA